MALVLRGLPVEIGKIVGMYVEQVLLPSPIFTGAKNGYSGY